MDSTWCSDVIAERDQFASWRDACCRHVYAITPERPSRGPFRGRIEARRFGELDVVALSCEGHRVSRSREDIARVATDTYYLYCQGADSAWFQQRDRELVVHRGDIVVADPNIPFSTGAARDFDFRIWRVPRRAMDPLIANSGNLPMTSLSHCDGMGALVSSYLTALAGQLGRIDRGAEDAIAQNVVRLVALAVGMAPGMHDAGREAVRSAKLLRVLQHIDRHLAEPNLTPSRVATATGISLRQLHQLFEPKGTSFSRWVQRRRLEEIHALLATPASRGRTITEIAFAWGFNDLSTFYRAFRGAYGAHPGDVRAAAFPGHRQQDSRAG
ncbi:MAG: helix-turn-helix domain-containing protein [Stellaceae bacterium]